MFSIDVHLLWGVPLSPSVSLYCSYNASDDLHHPGLDEMQLVQLRNGSIMALARNCADPTGAMKQCMMAGSDPDLERGQGDGGKRVMVSISSSSSGGEQWSHPRPHPELLTPVCNFGVTYYRDAVLFSGPYSEAPAPCAIH